MRVDVRDARAAVFLDDDGHGYHDCHEVHEDTKHEGT